MAGTYFGVARKLQHPRRSKWYQSDELDKIFQMVGLSFPWVQRLMNGERRHLLCAELIESEILVGEMQG